MNPLLSIQSNALFTLSCFKKEHSALHQQRLENCLALQEKATIPLSTEPLVLPTTEADEMTAELFLEKSQNYAHPVLLRGFVKDAQSTQRWDLDYFIETCGKSYYKAAVGKINRLSVWIFQLEKC